MLCRVAARIEPGARARPPTDAAVGVRRVHDEGRGGGRRSQVRARAVTRRRWRSLLPPHSSLLRDGTQRHRRPVFAACAHARRRVDPEQPEGCATAVPEARTAALHPIGAVCGAQPPEADAAVAAARDEDGGVARVALHQQAHDRAAVRLPLPHALTRAHVPHADPLIPRAAVEEAAVGVERQRRDGGGVAAEVAISVGSPASAAPHQRPEPDVPVRATARDHSRRRLCERARKPAHGLTVAAEHLADHRAGRRRPEVLPRPCRLLEPSLARRAVLGGGRRHTKGDGRERLPERGVLRGGAPGAVDGCQGRDTLGGEVRQHGGEHVDGGQGGVHGVKRAEEKCKSCGGSLA
eukprot:3331556-Prymnesium_polylepis.1